MPGLTNAALLRRKKIHVVYWVHNARLSRLVHVCALSLSFFSMSYWLSEVRVAMSEAAQVRDHAMGQRCRRLWLRPGNNWTDSNCTSCGSIWFYFITLNGWDEFQMVALLTKLIYARHRSACVPLSAGTAWLSLRRPETSRRMNCSMRWTRGTLNGCYFFIIPGFSDTFGGFVTANTLCMCMYVHVHVMYMYMNMDVNVYMSVD